MPKITANIPASLNSVLHDEIARTKTDASSIGTAALAQYLQTPIHTLFQVSTSGALVAGVYSGAVSVRSLLQHGDTGLGTFANLDGEMVVLEGHAYQVQGSGRVSEAPANAGAPFAVVTKFSPETDLRIGPVADLGELEKRCDALRTSGNIFYAFRVDGTFKRIRTRAVNPPEASTRLVDAAKVQSEFSFTDVAGTLVGFERAVIFARGGALECDLPGNGCDPTSFERMDVNQPEREYLTEPEIRRRERENLFTVLQKTSWKVKGTDGAAELLGVKPSTGLDSSDRATWLPIDCGSHPARPGEVNTSDCSFPCTRISGRCPGSGLEQTNFQHERTE